MVVYDKVSINGKMYGGYNDHENIVTLTKNKNKIERIRKI